MADQETIAKQVRSLIYKERPNTILAHFRTCFHGNEGHYFGNITDNKFQIWYTRGTTLGYHPVIHGEVSISEHDEPAVNLKPVLNPFGFLQGIIGTIVTILLTIFMLPTGTGAIITFLVSCATTLILFGIVYFIYRYETKFHLEQFKERLDNEL